MSAHRYDRRPRRRTRSGRAAVALTVLSVGLVGLVAGCGSSSPSSSSTASSSGGSTSGGSSSSSSSAGTVTATLGIVAAIPNYFSMYGAQELGIAKQLGVKVQVTTTSESDCVSAVVSGSLLACPVSLDTAQDAIKGGANIRVVATDEYPAVNTLVVKSSIKSWSQLRGQAIAANGPGTSSIAILALLAQHGIKPSDITMLSIGGSPDRYAALQAGKTAGAILAMPQEAVALQAGFRQLGDPTAANSIGDYLIAKPGLTGSKQQALIRLIAAMDKADQYVSNPANKAKVLSLWQKNFQMTAAQAAGSYKQNVTQFNTWKGGTALSQRQLATVAALDAKYTTLNKDESPSSFEDTSYLEAAQKLQKK